MINALRLLSMVLVAISMAAGFAHLLALPNKIDLPAREYLIVQQVYRGWALLGIAVVGALVATALLTWVQRDRRPAFYLCLGATVCVALALVVFFSFTYPANQATSNWTTLPEDWRTLRAQWEYSHAVGAALYLLALIMLTSALLSARR